MNIPIITLPPGAHALNDYDLYESGTTDICIKLVSSEVNPYQNEFFIEDGEGSLSNGHNHPMIVTIPDFVPGTETTNPGSKVGTFVNVRTSDNVYETLIEGGSQHRLLHVYEINTIPYAATQTLVVEGSRPDNDDGDDFQILYRWSASACTTSGAFISSGIVINSSTEQTYTATIGSSSGRLCVAVDDTTGGSFDDSVDIDYVEVKTASCP